MTEKDKNISRKLNAEIDKINKKENNIYFLIVDTKGVPSGSLSYIYKMAMTLFKDGYKVTMLYDVPSNDFVGVGDWLGDEYMKIPHLSVSEEVNLEINASDIMLFQDIHSSAMKQTKKAPCKRIAILQNKEFVTDTVPLGVQWGDYNIFNCLTNTVENSETINKWFPYVKTEIIDPPINDDLFHNTVLPKNLIVNIVSKNQNDINKIVKPFLWEYPAYKWVSFKDLNGLPQNIFAQELRDNAITIWVDDDTNFGYTPLEAMKSGSIILGKIPQTIPEWAINKETNDLKNCCVWFDNFKDLPKILGNIILMWTNDTLPKEFNGKIPSDEVKETIKPYNEFLFNEKVKKYFSNLNSSKNEELEKLLNTLKNTKKSK